MSTRVTSNAEISAEARPTAAPISHRRPSSSDSLSPETVLQALPCALFRKDMNGRFTYVNSHFCIRKRLSAVEMLGRSDADLFPPKRAEHYRMDDLCVLMTGRVQQHIVSRPSVDGQSQRVQVIKTPVYDADGLLAGIQGMLWDIPAEKADDRTAATPGAQTSPRTDDQRPSASQRQVPSVTHLNRELSLPLAGIVENARLLLATHLHSPQREHADTIHRSAGALLGAVDELAGLLRDANEADAHPADFDLVETIEETLAPHAATAARKGMEVRCDIPPDVAAGVHGDRRRLQRALDRLFECAIRPSSGGDISVTIAAEPDADGTLKINLTLRKTDLLPETMDVLRNVATHQGLPGACDAAGLSWSLAIARCLIGSLHGSFDVGPDGESEMILRLTVNLHRTGILERKVQTAERVLIVSDDDATRASLRHQLAAIGAPYDSAADADEALALLHAASEDSNPYATAVLDLRAPEMPSLKLARLIHSFRPLAATRLLLLTRAGEHLSHDALSAAGLANQLERPVQRRLLLEALNTLSVTPDPASAGLSAMPSAPTSIEKSVPKPPRILLVDDNEVNRMVGLGLLRALGHTADTATNGREAMRCFEQNPYDIIFMDCQMPEMDGYEATRRIRELEAIRGGQAARAHVIAVTANTMDGDREKCFAAGMDDYLPKPVTLAALKASVIRAPALCAS